MGRQVAAACVLMGAKAARLLRAIRGPIRAVLFPAQYLCLLLWDQRSPAVELPLLPLLGECDDILLLLVELRRLHLVPVEALDVLEALL